MTTILSHDALDAARRMGDPEADAVVTSLGREAWAVNATLRHLHRNGDPIPDGVPERVRRFCSEDVALPPWFDVARVGRAQRWASRHALHVTVALFCASLPTAYAAARGARVLRMTGRMEGTKLDRRVNETAQFVLDAIAEGAFAPEGCAIRSIQKVRLVHAAVRRTLSAKNDGDDEVPINQEDMLGTLCTFSVVVTRSLRRLGVPVGDDEAEDYFQLWRAVGAMLGIRDDLLPRDERAALDVAERIAERHFRASADGRALMAALLAGMEEHVPVCRFAPRYLVRHLVGETIADHLGVPCASDVGAQLALLRLLPRRSTRPLASAALGLSSLLGRPLLGAVVMAKLRGAAPAFAMP
jgi:hypothetical protein